MRILSGVLTAVFICFGWISYYLVLRTDPGVVLPTDPEIDCVPPGAEPMEDPPPGSSPIPDESVTNQKYKNGQHLRWCSTCRIWRPPRVSHCRWCGYCMYRFDHHCPAIMNCVALKNHRWFLCLIAACAFTGVWLTFCTVYRWLEVSKRLTRNLALNLTLNLTLTLTLTLLLTLALTLTLTQKLTSTSALSLTLTVR